MSVFMTCRKALKAGGDLSRCSLNLTICPFYFHLPPPPLPMRKSSGFPQLISSLPQPPAKTSPQACNWGEGGKLVETS